ncbi:MAG: integration host factor subunit beta [Deltaproteobacteria bacterium]|nr:integration host factor subunit beta [Deltaproteobacteria bacterium]
MNKSELVERLAERAKVTKKRAEQVVNLVFDQMTQALKRGERIEIRGFGSFTSKAYPAYTGRNPRTGETIHVPAKRLPFFKVGKELKERVDYAPGARPRSPVAVGSDDASGYPAPALDDADDATEDLAAAPDDDDDNAHDDESEGAIV